jgi:hypothetical protein
LEEKHAGNGKRIGMADGFGRYHFDLNIPDAKVGSTSAPRAFLQDDEYKQQAAREENQEIEPLRFKARSPVH